MKIQENETFWRDHFNKLYGQQTEDMTEINERENRMIDFLMLHGLDNGNIYEIAYLFMDICDRLDKIETKLERHNR